MNIKNLLDSGHPLIWKVSMESELTNTELKKEIISFGFNILTWNIIDGMPAAFNKKTTGFEAQNEKEIEVIIPPEEAIDIFCKSATSKSVLIMYNLDKFFGNFAVIQIILNNIKILQANNKCIIVLTNQISVPSELERYFVIDETELPDLSELKKYLLDIISPYVANGKLITNDEEISQVVNMGKGLTKFEFINAISLCLVQEKRLNPKTIGLTKTQMIKKSRNLEMGIYPTTYDNVGGMSNLKEYLIKLGSKLLTEDDTELRLIKGVMLLGAPGCGKSLISQAAGNMLNIPLVKFDFARLFGKFVGESEQAAYQSLKTIESMAPCIAYMDEIEKALGGSSGGESDGGTSSRVFGIFLTWLQERKPGILVIATCNDISKLPKEFLRYGRWNNIFFVDLPKDEEREEIIKIHMKRFGYEFNIKDIVKITEGFSGAEIEELFCQMKIMDIKYPELAVKYIIPMSCSKKNELDMLREFASTRAIPA